MQPKDDTTMADPAAAPTTDALDIDIGPVPSGLTMPPWLATLLVAIGAIVPIPADLAFEALSSLLAPYRRGGTMRAAYEALPPALQGALQTAKDGKLGEINRPRIVATAPVALVSMPPVAPATERQSIPVVRGADEGAVLLAASEPMLRMPIVQPGKWYPLMGERGNARQQTSSERQRRVNPTVWGGRIEHAPESPVVVGSLVRLTRSHNGTSTVHAVTRVVTTDGLTSVVEVRTATAADQAPRAVATGSAPVLRDVEIAPGMVLDTGAAATRIIAATAEQALADIASEGAARAATSVTPSVQVAPTERGNGTSADSGASVGIFERPAAERRMLVGNGAIQLHDRFGNSRTVQTSGTTTERARLLTERHLIVGNLAGEHWLQVSWTGQKQIQHGAATDALIAVGREGDAPGVPSAEHFASEALNVLRGRSWDIRRASKSDTPDTDDRGRKIKARWIVGRVGALGDVDAGDAYGSIKLRVDLIASGDDEDTLAFDGDSNLADQVRTEYTMRVAGVVLTSRVLTPWLGRILRTRHGAVKRGHCWYVPPGHASAVRALIGGPAYAARVDEIIAGAKPGEELPPLPAFDKASIGAQWGDHELQACTTGPMLFASLTRALFNGAQQIADDFALATTQAQERAGVNARKAAAKRHGVTEAYIEAQAELASKRATVSPDVAARLLKELGTVAAYVSGYRVVLGEAHVTEASALIASLRSKLEGLTTDDDLMGAMLELDREEG